ncbi:protein FAR1-RELATED SEQUENCE 3-like [Abrus precatorius]|uniref:Protein FAR1-RELATED SEQUENCE n=1 Tax=Abrus precatorius TaxID=3816 RepID=A0A8B8KW11_ABRPR|nr:protein FAR1-RELATED SEQUENCE 3-like [Abrus precatorius]
MDMETNLSSRNEVVMNSEPLHISQSSVEELNVEPHVGMEFDSLKKVEDFYKLFAKMKGFGIRIRSSKKYYCIFVCVREGERLFDNNHNHDMASPKSVSFFRCHRKMNAIAKNLVERFNEEGLPTEKVVSIFNASGSSFFNRDCWNHMRNVRNKNLDVGDAQGVLNCCKQKQAQNSDFFNAIQCDDDAKMMNLFWADARSRLVYECFGDVITFDTTYKTNKYSMPFAPFTGINHHFQSILFGCALLQDESETSFIWLFETLLEAMKGKKPMSIIIDQDLAIGAVVAKVFPKSRHRLCLWHIRKKFPEKLAHIYHKNSSFKRELKRCIRESSIIRDFEDDWQHIMVFEKAINHRYEAEKREDFKSRHKSRILSIGSKIKEHTVSIYTRNVFRKFHDEFVSVTHFTKEKVEKNGLQYKYRVSNCFNARDTFLVDINLESKNATCGCQLYEIMGILCRHILVIFQAKNIVQIPTQYILQRWTKEANQYLAKKSKDAYNFILVDLDCVYNDVAKMVTETSVTFLEPNQENLMFETLDDVSNCIIKDSYISQTKGRKKKSVDKVAMVRRYKNALELATNKTLVKRRQCKSCGEYGYYQSTCKKYTT